MSHAPGSVTARSGVIRLGATATFGPRWEPTFVPRAGGIDRTDERVVAGTGQDREVDRARPRSEQRLGRAHRGASGGEHVVDQ